VTILDSGKRPGRAREGLGWGIKDAQRWRWPLASFQDAVKMECGCAPESGGSHSLRSFHHRLVSFEPPARREEQKQIPEEAYTGTP
jgi:hypothetical protein